jgi:PAS domain S-box-containing protein
MSNPHRATAQGVTLVTFDDHGSNCASLLRKPHFLADDRRLADMIHVLAWERTCVGPLEDWPIELRTLVGVMLSAGQPMFIAWGAARTLIYNDAYAEVIGNKHPRALGAPLADVFAEAWTDIGPLVDDVFGGTPVHMDDITLVLDRNGTPAEAHFNFSYTPVRDDLGSVVALFCVASETTERIFAERELAMERQRQQRMLQQMPGFVALLQGPEHIYEYVNDAYVELSGRRDFLGRAVRDVFPELDGQGFYELLDQVYAGGEAFTSPSVAVRLIDETEDRFLDLLYEPIKAEDGSITGVFVCGYDITGVHKTSRSLRESEAYIRLILASTSEGFYAVDCDGRTTLCNDAFLTMLGFADDSEVLGRKLHDVIHHTRPDGSHYDKAACPLYLCASTGKKAHVRNEFFYRTDGSAVPVEYWAHPIFQGGELRGAICNFLDVTEQRETETALRELNETLELKVETRTLERDRAWKNSQDLQVVVGADGLLRTVNTAWTTILGWEPEELIGRHHLELSHPDDRVASQKILAMASAEEIPTYENRCLHKDGSYRWIAWVAAPDEGAIYASGRHVTAEREIAAALGTVQARLKTMFETSFQLQCLCALNGTLLNANATSLAVIGVQLEDVIGRLFWHTPWFASTPGMPGLIKAAMQAGADGHASRQELSLNVLGGLRTYDFSIRPVRDAEGAVIGVVPEAVDITERRLAEEGLRQSRKLEAMGQLTGGVAHDFNNLLTPIMLSLDMLRTRNLGTERDQRRVEHALEATNRARTLVQRLLAFARRQPLARSAVDIPQLVGGMVSLLGSTLGPDIRVVLTIDTDLPPVIADANQLEMAILNLGVNARDAMPEGGILTISASTERVAKRHRSGLAPGSFVRLCLADTGTGMDDETRARAVEPFFSTKAVGQGTGLGLSMVHGLALQLDGAMTILTAPNAGTQIELWLPISEQPAQARSTVGSVSRLRATPGTVALLVDDDALVRASTADMLDEIGYVVIQAPSAEEALKVLADGTHVDVLVSDHIMAGMSGTELARTVLDSYPGINVLVVSGYADAGAFAPEIPHLTKPFYIDDLTALLLNPTLSPPAGQPNPE